MTGLKLIEGGLPRETIAFVALAAVPVQVVLPALLRCVCIVRYLPLVCYSFMLHMIKYMKLAAVPITLICLGLLCNKRTVLVNFILKGCNF